jgi:hypothetical protein
MLVFFKYTSTSFVRFYSQSLDTGKGERQTNLKQKI